MALDPAAPKEPEHGFLSRWSLRKQALRQGQTLAEPLPLEASSQVVDDQLFKRKVPLAGVSAALNAPDLIVGSERGDAANASSEPPSESQLLPPPPAPSLQDAQLLTPQSDFKPFMRADVLPEVKNAAMKQLFKDPHFNIMDMMDIYVDDYSKPDPLPPEMLRKMAVTQFLGFWDETEEEKAAKAQAELDKSEAAASTSQEPSSAQTREDAKPDVGQNVAQSNPTTHHPSQATSDQPLIASQTHDHPDLQLQPDDAARREGIGPSA